jgi:hypothetical protein
MAHVLKQLVGVKAPIHVLNLVLNGKLQPIQIIKKYKVSHITDKYKTHNKLYNPREHNKRQLYPTHIKTFTLLRTMNPSQTLVRRPLVLPGKSAKLLKWHRINVTKNVKQLLIIVHTQCSIIIKRNHERVK